MIKPLIAVPLGDPAGVGPEIVVKALANESLRDAARILVVGDSRIVKQALDFTGVNLKVVNADERNLALVEKDAINVLDLGNISTHDFVIGDVNAAAGRAAFEYIEKAVALANAGIVDGIATTPINKKALQAANIPFIGHTEIFASLTNTEDPLTMFEVRNLRIFFLTRHVSLRKACDLVTKQRIVDYTKRIVMVLTQLGIENPTIAVAGLNPHSGEDGLFGDEEMLEVAPAVLQLQEEGYQVAGPIGADSVFHQALTGRYDCVLSLYHDQGHIAAKTLDFERTISVTCGMPILRTSVDHGTAFDIAGKNIASEVSMVEAIRLAAHYAPRFIKGTTP